MPLAGEQFPFRFAYAPGRGEAQAVCAVLLSQSKTTQRAFVSSVFIVLDNVLISLRRKACPDT